MYMSGNYYFCNSAVDQVLTESGARVSVWAVTSAVTISNLFAKSAVPYRLGIWADDGCGRPGPLILDAGTGRPGTSGVQEVCGLSNTFTPGLYWVGGVEQGGFVSTNPPRIGFKVT